MDDNEIRDELDPADEALHTADDLDNEEVGVDAHGKPKKDLIDDDTVSLDDEVEEELGDEEEPLYDVDEM